MDMSVIVALALLAAALVGGITSVIIVSKRQEARKKIAPSAHRGAFQSQKNRVFKKGSTDHNAAPTSPS